MKFQFKVQKFQTAAVDAVADCFAGQPRHDGISYRIDPGRKPTAAQQTLAVSATEDSGFRNAQIMLDPAQLLHNLHAVQRSQSLPLSSKLEHSKAAPGAPNLDVEMETGTGKTYVYIKTIMELNKRYGWSKYIVVVPSVAIREGVKKSFDITAEHFQQHYGTKPRSFIYNSLQLHELERFSSDAGVQVMVINIQAFNSASKDNRRIYDELDDFQSRRPIDVISANRPIVIIDEPQKIGAAKSLESLANFNALMVLRYSATHKVEHNKVHRLDALDAFNQKLVKRIAVRGITIKGLAGSTAYLYVDAIEVVRGANPRARVEIEVQTRAGPIRRQVKRLNVGANLHDISGGIEAYKGLFVVDIDANRDIIEMSNGDVVVAGQLADRDVTEESKRRIQIREVIRAHLDKERELFAQGVKVLSLLFIDEVAKYRDYGRDDTMGDYARVFEEEYQAAVEESLGELVLDSAAERYRAYLQRDEVRDVHEGYFAVDKKTKRLVDPKVSGRGDDKGHSTDQAAYDLILKHKERLLSFDEPVRFIFSHSALREGWDNPNVFAMGMLKKSENTVSRRQEIGRGLRIAVNQHGDRMDNPATVHQINELTVVTDESYTNFVDGLQKEIAASLLGRPRKATPDFFAGKLLKLPDAPEEEMSISLDEAKQLQHWLIVNELIDYEQHLTDRWLDRLDTDVPPMPAGLQKFHHQVAELIDSLDLDIPLPTDGRKPKQIPLNEKNFDKKEFQELWSRINRKAVYQVEFDSAELIGKCIGALDKHLHVSPLQYVVQAGEQSAELEAEDLEKGEAFAVVATTTHTETETASSQVQYDLLGEIAEDQADPPHCLFCVAGSSQVRSTNTDRIPSSSSPKRRLISEQKATVIVEHLTYDTLADQHDTAIFTENQTKQDFTKAGKKLEKHIYDYVVTDSKVSGRS